MHVNFTKQHHTMVIPAHCSPPHWHFLLSVCHICSLPGCVMLFSLWFHLHFPDCWWGWAFFCMFTGHWDFLFGEVPVQVFTHIGLFSYFLGDLEDSLGIPGFNPSSIMYIVNILPFSLILESWDECLNFRVVNLSSQIFHFIINVLCVLRDFFPNFRSWRISYIHHSH